MVEMKPYRIGFTAFLHRFLDQWLGCCQQANMSLYAFLIQIHVSIEVYGACFQVFSFRCMKYVP